MQLYEKRPELDPNSDDEPDDDELDEYDDDEGDDELDEYDDEPEDEGDEPDEGDYTMTPAGSLGSKTSVAEVGGKHLGTFDSDAKAAAFIRDRMEQEKFWPNVWNVSDHGNAHLVTDLDGLAADDDDDSDDDDA